MKNILVTGGAGYIGSHTVVELIAAGYHPIIVDNFSTSNPKIIKRLEKLTGKSTTYYQQDYQDKEKLASVLTKEKIDGVIHFAAYRSVGESVEQPLKYYSNNVAGLVSLLQVLEKHKIKNLIFSSSCTIYGQADKLPITEEEPMKPPVSPYGATKQFGEIIIGDTTKASQQLRSLCLRYFNPIGAHPSGLIGELPIGTPANLVPYITQTAAGLRPSLVVHGDTYPTKDGTCIRDYLHVVDLAKAHVKALSYLEKKKAGYHDYCNFGTGVGSSVLEVIKSFEKVSGKKLTYTIGPAREGDATSAYAAVNKAREMFGWSAEKSLADALLDAWHWQQSLAKDPV